MSGLTQQRALSSSETQVTLQKASWWELVFLLRQATGACSGSAVAVSLRADAACLVFQCLLLTSWRKCHTKGDVDMQEAAPWFVLRSLLFEQGSSLLLSPPLSLSI